MTSTENWLAGLETCFGGGNLVFLPETSSTNDEARRLAEEGAPEGTLVITDHQTAGRGRLDRRWEAPPGSSLLMSLLFRPPLTPAQSPQLTMMCGLAVADAIEIETGLCVGLKWPNDIVIGMAKLGGILTEIALRGERLDFAVVGIGLNINVNPADLPGEMLVPATSLSHELGTSVTRRSVLGSLLEAIERRYATLKAGHSPHLEWAARLVTVGQPVIVSVMGAVLEGVAEGVNANGALLIRQEDGGLRAIFAGDVTLRQPGH